MTRFHNHPAGSTLLQDCIHATDTHELGPLSTHLIEIWHDALPRDRGWHRHSIYALARIT